MNKTPVLNDKFPLPMDQLPLSIQKEKLPGLRSYPPTLLANTGCYLWEKRILELPADVAKMSFECQQGFIKCLRHLEVFSFRSYHPSRSAQTSAKKWKKISAIILKDEPLDTIFKIRKIGSYIFVFILFPCLFRDVIKNGIQKCLTH